MPCEIGVDSMHGWASLVIGNLIKTLTEDDDNEIDYKPNFMQFSFCPKDTIFGFKGR